MITTTTKIDIHRHQLHRQHHREAKRTMLDTHTYTHMQTHTGRKGESREYSSKRGPTLASECSHSRECYIAGIFCARQSSVNIVQFNTGDRLEVRKVEGLRDLLKWETSKIMPLSRGAQ
jgi:hypothetical protein